MKKFIVLLMLLFAFACGGREGNDPNVTVASPGSEVPTQTTTEVVQIPDTEGTAAAGGTTTSPGTPVPSPQASPQASPQTAPQASPQTTP
jgi:hypothetical protein